MIVILSFLVLLLIVAGVAWRQYQWWKSETWPDDDVNDDIAYCRYCGEEHTSIDTCPGTLV